MPDDSPKIYPVDQVKLVEQVQKLAIHYCSSEYFPEAWKDISSIQSDKQADALIRIFARMMEIVIHRLNKVPDKNFLTFLDMVGIRLSPPRVARVPLTFTMASGASRYVSIVTGIQVATAETKGQEAVVFETEKELTVIVPMLVKAVSLSPEDDKWTDHSPGLFDSIEENIKLFKGRNLTPHRLYLGHSKLFSFKEEIVITLKIELSNDPQEPTDSREPDEWEVKWYYFDEKSVPRLFDIETAKSPSFSDDTTVDRKVANLLKSGSITFKPVAGVAEKTLTGIEQVTNRNSSWISNWIFAELSTPVPAGSLPTISSISASVGINPESPITPDLAYFNSVPLDLSKDFYPFGEQPKFNDTFYIGSKEVFSKKDAKITVGVTLSSGLDAPASEKIKLCWESWNGSNWEIIGEAEKDHVSISKYNFTDETKALTVKDGERIVTFTCPNIEEKEINGEKNRWVRVRIIEGNYGDEARYEESPTFKGTGNIRCDQATVSVYGNGTAFNKEIRIGNSIIVTGKNGIQTRMITSVISDNSLTIDSPFSNDTTETEFYINKIGWAYIPSTYKPPSINKLTLEYTFVSEDFPEVILAYNDFAYQNCTNYLFNWDQVTGNDTSRLLNYLMQNFDTSWLKEDAKIDKSKDNSVISISDGKNSLSLTLGSDQSNNEKVSLTINGVKKYELTVKVENNNKRIYDKTKMPFTPFQSVADKESTLYLAFDRDISTLPVTIFFPLLQARSRFSDTSLHGDSQAIPFLIWQYWTGKEWDKLKIEDNTDNLTKRELIEFLAPANIAKRSCFGFESEHYWIRAVLKKGRYEDFPSLKAIYTNTVWARNMVTVKDETLGFSNGMPDQIFSFSRSPILSGQKVLVRELSLSEEDKKTIFFEEGEDAIEKITDDAGSITGFWVRWHEMKNFYFSKPYSRHYTADLNNGTITFGNGYKGMVPPAGKDNIKCSYQSGDGVKGNVQAGTITKLRTTFPYIDSVTNYEAADGGCDKENLDRIRERGPQTLKHRDRAVTYEDFEWLVREASPIVAKVKCLPTRDPSLRLKPGWVTLIVVPDSNDPKPLPTPQLVNEIETYLFDRTSSYLTTYPSQINLIGPGYIKVWVEASVQFTSITEAKTIEKRILDNLQQFFHSLHGGPEKKGWDFGRNVCISEVYELIENTNGVDYVNNLTLRAAVQVYKLKLKESKALSNSFPKHSTVNFNSGHVNQITFFLAELLPKDMIIDEFYIVGFKEGDQVKISDSKGNYILTLSVKSVLDNKLECETDMAISVPKGSIVETPDGIRSYTTADSKQNDQSNILLTLATFSPRIISSGIEVMLNHRGNSIKEYLKINESTNRVETIFIDENCLIYSGDHAINK